MKNRLWALILTGITLSGLLAGCGGETNGTGNTSDDGSSGGDAENKYAYIDEYVEGLAADHTFDGATFTVVGRGLTEGDGSTYNRNGAFPMVEEYTGALENDALWDRQRSLEKIFNIDIVNEQVDPGDNDGYGAPTALLVSNTVTAGIPTYDLVEGNLMTCGRLLVEKGALLDAKELDGIDLSRDWWLNDIESQLSMGGNLYFLTGKISTRHYGDAACLLFNKKVMENYSIGEPYELVETGEWTFDKMCEVAQVIPSSGDVYRIMVGGAGSSLPYYYGAGYSITEKDDEDFPAAPKALSNEQVNYINKLATVIGNTSITYNYAKYGAYGVSDPRDMEEEVGMFNRNKVLFWNTNMDRVAEMRQYEAEFGILPLPKGDASQENYISYTSAWTVSGFFVPANVKDTVMVGYVTEGMAALSEKYLEPAYYESALVQRGVYDMDSKAMLDIIYKGKKLEIADIYSLSDIVSVIDNNCNGSKEDLASSYGTSAVLTNNAVKKMKKNFGVK